MTTCPKCGRSGYGGEVVERRVRLASPPWERVYRYRRYRHYVGSKKAITLKALEQIIKSYGTVGEDSWIGMGILDRILEQARQKAGTKEVIHYGPVDPEISTGS